MARARKYTHRGKDFRPLWVIVTYCIATILLFAPASYATVINVPSAQPTIQAGIDAAVDGDTVLVAPGIYRENLVVVDKGLSIIGEQNSGSVSLQPDDLDLPAIVFFNAQKSEFSSFTVAGGFSYRLIHVCYYAEVLISNCMFLGFQGNDSDKGWVIHVEGNAAIYKNLFFNNLATGCVGISTCDSGFGRAIVVNNTFDNNNGGVKTTNDYGIVRNNIITNNGNFGLSGNFEESDYNCVWFNTIDYDSGATAGLHDLSTDPLFTNPGTFDYTLQNNSPCIDTGDPDPQYNDSDGTPGDMGAFPVIRSHPGVIWFYPDGEEVMHVIGHIPTFYWHYYDVENPQTAYEIEMGTDADWTATELWATGEVISSDTFVVYDGLPLEDGVTACVRVRVNNGNIWGEWFPFSFRMNSEPTVPGLVTPIGGEQANYDFVLQRISNSNDDQNDSLCYHVEIYKDIGLADLVFEETEVPEESVVTRYRPMFEFEIGREFWWRARAYDGFEYSEWSVAESFIASDGPYIRVPDDWATIQQAIDATAMGGVVLVSPGDYAETISFPEHSIKVKSSNGPKETIIKPTPSENYVIALTGSRYSVLSGFSVSGEGIAYPAYAIIGDDGVIENCKFTEFVGADSGSSVIRVESNAFIQRNLFFDNFGLACISIDSGQSAHIVNNTLDHNRNGVYSYSEKGIVENNIVVNSIAFGIYGLFDTCQYNCLWNNTYNRAQGDSNEFPLSETDINSNPLFMYPFHPDEDYRLSPESPCIAAGNPDQQYNDPDGSRNDIGAYPFEPRYPIPVDINFGPVSTGNNVHTLVPMFGWSYQDTASTIQAGYEIEVGNENNWQLAEMWSSGEIISGDENVTYGGTPLEDLHTYVLRIRLNNGEHWGDWIIRKFYTCEEESDSDWPMFQGNALHTGHNPHDKIRPPLERKWSRKLYDYYLSPITVAGDNVLVSPHDPDRPRGQIWCLNSADGNLVWWRDYGIISGMSQPSYGYGLVYVQVTDMDSYVDAIDINTGNLIWRSYYQNQWYLSHAPTVHEGKVTICGDYYGGMHTFNALTGEPLWRKQLFGPFEGVTDGWTPAAYGDELFVFIPGWLLAIDINDGEDLWGVNLVPGKSTNQQPTFSPGRFTVPAVDTMSNLIYMAGGTTFHVVSMETREIVWDVFGRVFGVSPTVYDGVVYTIRGGILRAFEGMTGDSLWAYQCPEYFISGIVHYNPDWITSEYCPIVANGHLYVSSCENIYAFDLENYELVWSYPVAGHISIAHEQLYVSSWDGIVHAFGMIPTDVENEDETTPILPNDYTLSQNYPNPFNASTRIDYSLPRSGNVTITIYNILGETVRELVNEYKPAGEYMAIWNGKDNHNVTLASGIYIYRLVVNNHAEAKTMLLLK